MGWHPRDGLGGVRGVCARDGEQRRRLAHMDPCGSTRHPHSTTSCWVALGRLAGGAVLRHARPPRHGGGTQAETVIPAKLDGGQRVQCVLRESGSSRILLLLPEVEVRGSDLLLLR